MATASYPSVPISGNYTQLPNVVYDPVGHQFVAPQASTTATDSSNNVIYAPTLVQQTGAGSTSGNLQTAAVATGNGTPLVVLGYSTVVATVTGITTATITWEVTEDGTNWVSVNAIQSGTNTVNTTATANGDYVMSCAGFAQVRGRISAWTSGTITVTAHAVPGANEPRVVNANLVSGSTSFVAKAASVSPALADVSLVTALSPNNSGLPVNLPVIVQKTNNVSTGSVTTLAKAFVSNNVAGNSIIVVAASGSNTAMTVADSAGNTYTSAVAGAQSTTVGAAIFYAVNILAGANTVTLTCASSSAALEIYEVSGILQQVQGALGQSSSGNSSSATALVTSNIAGTGNCLAFMGAGIGTAAQNITVTTGSGWTADAGTNGLVTGATVAGLYQLQSLSQFLPGIKPVLPTATAAGAEPYAAVAAVFRPVSIGIEGTVTLGGYSYTNIVSATTTLIKTGLGVLHAIVVNTPVGSGVIEFDDALTHTTPKIGTITFPATILSIGQIPYLYDLTFTTGLSITTTGTMDITVVWR